MLRHIKTGTFLLSIVYLILGLMLLVMPETSLLWICYAFGAVVLLTGVVCLVQYARLHGKGFAAPFLLVGGVITGALGIFTLLRPQTVASILPIVFGIFILVDGFNRIASGVELAKQKGHKWWVLVLLGVLSLALGFLLIWRPFDIAVSMVMVCGALLVVEGALNLGCVLYAAMELAALERVARSALNATLAAAGELLDEVEEEQAARDSIVYEAESTEVLPEETDPSEGEDRSL